MGQDENKIKIAKYLRNFSRIMLLIITIFWFIFALLSGSEELGGGLKGILLNSPNTLPWLLLFVVVYIAWKWQILGGIIVSSLGIFSIFFFKTYKSIITIFGITFPLIIIGLFLIISNILESKNSINN